VLQHRNAVADRSQTWHGGVVPYMIESYFRTFPEQWLFIALLTLDIDLFIAWLTLDIDLHFFALSLFVVLASLWETSRYTTIRQIIHRFFFFKPDTCSLIGILKHRCVSDSLFYVLLTTQAPYTLTVRPIFVYLFAAFHSSSFLLLFLSKHNILPYNSPNYTDQIQRGDGWDRGGY